ncbi:hypothetical protein V499_08280 [Pseudogymnoascus sp. VKM F-103]|uniref:Vacuolar ATPase assembly integral membrane protein vma21 n=1 Tax=Pseudogymnoascus verrucosus TaxID=342668 RepID=A0A1B8GJZ9_9PEZI|nr:vacuolar ATPase assembly integral membrane protein vma21 [Pseudogymnoascus verrucosus]KFY71527.1 hypothetical protein V499_08280 [Pseudogymnoascus sp. VKM F-103]OBT96149.1 vacuolar ATPase assembly integral membrane protein vma21 [Pseudogymnoascus verrucosus]
MATRRSNAVPATGEKTLAEDFKQPLGQPSITAPAVPMHVIVKLLAFTFAMVVVPIGSYFLTLDLVFSGNSTFAGATAAIMANVVLVGYIIVAMREDQSEAIEAAERERKGR